MISSIHLKNFKSHKNTKIQLSNLTLLCGENGSGKSSVIQSLLLLRQSYKKNRLAHGLSLNKPLCYIGTAEDALFQFAENEKIEIEVAYDNDQAKTTNWSFNAESGLTSDFIPLDPSMKSANSPVGLENIAFFNDLFQYISAGRITEYESDDYAVGIENQISIEEGKTELTAHYLYHFQDKTVPESLLHPINRDSKTLLSQVTAWEQEISKGVNVHPIQKGNSYEIKYSFETVSATGQTKQFSTRNIGFGVSYALPIIISILSAKPGSFIIVENPEAHLHPYGQAKLAELMCLAANYGIQVVAETHSDHVINGVLVQNKKSNIDKEKIKIWYFDRDDSENASSVSEVKILDKGRVKEAPQGFFDQIGKDLRVLMSSRPV